MSTQNTTPQTPNPLFHNKKYMFLQLGAVVVIALVMLIGFVPSWDNKNESFATSLILLAAVSFMYGITARHMNPKAKQENPNNNPYHSYFFKGTVVLTSLLTLFGIFGAFFVYVEHNNLFQAVGLATAVIWISVFLVYFMWSVYFYNINYGLTDQDWDKIYEIKELKRQGFKVEESEDVDVPMYNPYRSQTFGLPPGTVRGMIAFTLLMGGMSLLITSFGSGYTGMDMALLSQQFEFFETAFLMMIAFYFGDRSLKYISQRWSGSGVPNIAGGPDPNPDGPGPNIDNKRGPDATPRTGTKPNTFAADTFLVSNSPQMADDVDWDDADFRTQDRNFSLASVPSRSTILSQQKTLLSTSLKSDIVNIEGEEFVQVNDQKYSKVLSDMDIRNALEELEANQNITLSLPVVKAVITVESSGRGHLSDGRAKILFEGHVFWRHLQGEGINPEDHVKGNEDILFPTWTRQFYKGGIREYDRLDRAKEISPKAAVYSTSWGLFQILGENLENNIKRRNYADIDDFVAKQHESEYYHLLDFLEFIRTKQSRRKPLISYISEETGGNYDWEAFAYGYNGSAYAVNKYDEKMKAAYENFKAQGL